MGAVLGAMPGAIGALLVWLLAGCESGGQPGMVCYDIQRYLYQVTGIATAAGCVVGALIGLWLAHRGAS